MRNYTINSAFTGKFTQFCYAPFLRAGCGHYSVLFAPVLEDGSYFSKWVNLVNLQAAFKE
nr:hypothetical protein [uncultured Campylobacter sp.]